MRRKFSADGVMHIYQRTISGFNLFYSLEDFLVLYTIVAVQVRRSGVCLLGMCIMIDHLHLLVRADSLTRLSGFISAYTSLYVREFNSHMGRSGPLFEPPYGSALKRELKKIRSAIIYMFNNPVEKSLCNSASGYKWNFLKYYDPGMARLIKGSRNLSRELQRKLKMIHEAYRNDRYLNYAFLSRLLQNTDASERDMLTDYIIMLYFPFQKDMPKEYFRSYKDMVIAVDSSTGSEYEISEKHYCKTDLPYREILQFLKRAGVTDPKSLIMEPEDVKKRYYALLRQNTSATPVQIRKFLHMNPPRQK